METKDRIKWIIENEGLTQVEFSNTTGIKPPTLNHVLTGRNNASTEIVQKILSAYPKYSGEWLLNGTGDMYSSSVDSNVIQSNIPSEISLFGVQSGIDSNFRTGETVQNRQPNIHNTASFAPNAQLVGAKQPFSKENAILPEAPKRSVTKIIIFYDDNTYETFYHEQEKKTK